MHGSRISVGVLVRHQTGRRTRVQEQLEAIEGVSTLELDEPDAIGVVLEAPDADAAHAILRGRIERLEGVLCAWPLHTHLSP